MNFKNLFEELLTELSGSEIYQKFYSKIPYEEFLAIVKSDPQSVIEGDQVQKVGKYAKLLLTMYQRKTLKFEDLDRAQEYLGYVYTHKVPLDINKVKSLDDLYDVVKDYIAKDTRDFNKILEVLPSDQYKTLFNGKDWTIYQPLTEKSSCYLGYNTEWCTTWGPYSLNKEHKDKGSLFSRYHKNGPLFIIVNKHDQNEKYQFHFESKQYMDREDKSINAGQLLQNNPELLIYFFPSFKKEVSAEEMTNEYKRVDILPENLGNELLKKLIDVTDNILVASILHQDTERLQDLIQGENLIGEVSFNSDDSLVINLTQLTSDMQTVESNIRSYDSDAYYSYDIIYDDYYHRDYDEYEEQYFKDFLKPYFEDKKDEFSEHLGIIKFDDLIADYFKLYYENSEIHQAFSSDVADLSSENFGRVSEEARDEIKSTIDINEEGSRNYEILINSVKFIKFLLKKNIKQINEIDEVIDGFIGMENLDHDYDRIWDYEVVYPVYHKQGYYLEKETDKFFEKLFEGEKGPVKCSEYRRKFREIYDKYFKGGMFYETDEFMVHLKSTQVDCETGSVHLEYTNKVTGEKFGYKNEHDKVKIENLVSLLVNRKLFETKLKLSTLL